MKKTLGLDLGTNSLGWAVLSDITGDVLDKGVLVFPEDIDPAKDTVETPAAIRRAKRMGRRTKFRRRLRKWCLLEILIRNGMCPLAEEELTGWRKSGRYPVSNKAFIGWLKSTDTKNPYLDRAAAASGPVDKFVLGRALYHLAQRRGFKSSRKDGGESIGEKAAKDLGDVKRNIRTLTEEIAAAGCQTLGQYFAKVIADQKDLPLKHRIRARHTGRLEHYEFEFDAIMRAQGVSVASIRDDLHKAIFMQRPLRSQKHLVGYCPLEPRFPRAQISHPLVEEFRARAFVNNLSFEHGDGERTPLTPAERELAYGAFMKASPTMKFKDVSKLFKKKLAAENLKFHYYRDDEMIPTCSIRHRLNLNFDGIEYDEQTVFDALTFFDDDGKLGEWFKRHYPSLKDGQIQGLCKIHPKEGNASYSLRAIRKILVFLRKGYDLSTSRLMAKMPEMIANFSANEEAIVLGMRERQFRYRANRDLLKTESGRLNVRPLRLMELYRDYFRDNWGVQDKDWNRLYLRDDSPYSVDPNKPYRLPKVELGMIRNPLVQRAMTTLRRLVNYLRDHDKIDGETTIRIELARGVNDLAHRKAIQLWQQDRQKERADARAILGDSVSEDTVDRYILAKEQGFQCLYTGFKCLDTDNKNGIGLSKILSGQEFDIEHTIPRSLSGDDSMANKTLCNAVYNQTIKRGHVPMDCPDYKNVIYPNLRPWREKVAKLDKDYRAQSGRAKRISDPKSKSAARIRAIRTKLELDYWRDKLRRFETSSDKLKDPASGLSGFKRRQLVDAGVMSSHAVKFLRSVYERVYPVNGTATAFARKAWGVQGGASKDRSEHTHHAKDAMVIAALTPARFAAICAALKDDGSPVYRRPCDVCPAPYPDFSEKVRRAAGEILVKHVVRQTTLRQSSKRNVLARAHPQKDDPAKVVKCVLSRGDTVRGPLHKETYYGKIKNPYSATGAISVVERRPLEGRVAEVKGWLERIVDPAVRQIVSKSIQNFEKKGREKFIAGEIAMPSGVPIRRVRIFAKESFQDPWRVKEHAFASKKEHKRYLLAASAEKSNFRMAVFERSGKRTFRTDAKFKWAQEHKGDDYIPSHEQPGFLGYVYPGSMVLARGEEGSLSELSVTEIAKRLYFIRSLPSEKESRIWLQLHTAAGAMKDIADRGSKISISSPHDLVRIPVTTILSQMHYLEGIDFRMSIDGTIVSLR